MPTTHRFTILAVFLIFNLLYVALGAAIPADVIPDNETQFLHEEYMDMVLPGGVLRIYNSTQPVDTVEHTIKPLQKRDNWCAASSFYFRTTGTSPLVRDCSVIRDTAHRIPQTFYIPPRPSLIYVYSYASCAFAVRAKQADVKLGNDDVADLITDSINMFKRYINGAERVESNGEMQCQNVHGFTYTTLYWTIIPNR